MPGPAGGISVSIQDTFFPGSAIFNAEQSKGYAQSNRQSDKSNHCPADCRNPDRHVRSFMNTSVKYRAKQDKV